MRKCFLWIVSLIVLAGGVGLLVLQSGVISFQASQTPPKIETLLATKALNASVERHSTRQANPFPSTDENLLKGLNLYRVGCSECPGIPGEPNRYGSAFYPPVPQFPAHAPRRSEAEIHYIVKYGIRNTGMAAWGNLMDDEQIWQVSAFLNHIEQLPEPVAREWNRPAK